MIPPAELEILRRSEPVQIEDLEAQIQILAASRDTHRDFFTDGIVEERFQALEITDRTARNTEENVAGAQTLPGGASRDAPAHHQQARTLGKGGPCGGFAPALETETTQFIVGLVGEDRLQRSHG